MNKGREERNEKKINYTELVAKYRKEFTKYSGRLRMCQKMVAPIRTITISAMFIIFWVFLLPVFSYLDDTVEFLSDGMMLFLIALAFAGSIAAGIGIERLINWILTKYYQKKFDDLGNKIDTLFKFVEAIKRVERNDTNEFGEESENENTKENQTSENSGEQAPLPAFLLRPMDEFSEKFIGKDMITVRDAKCKYATEIYGEVAENNPKVVKYGTYEINESHIYSKEGESSWYVISTMKTPSVRTSDLKNSVLAPYNLSRSFKTPETLILLPDGKSYDGYSSIKMNYMGSYDNYARQKGLDEAVVFCHVFSLGDEMYKDFILCARKGDYSWKLETIIPAKHQQILPPDFVPPGYFFGSFQTL